MFIFNHVKYSAFGKLLTNVQFQCIFIINAEGEYFQLWQLFFILSCVALRAALAGDHLQSYSDIKGIVHCSQKQKVLFLAKRKLIDILWNGCIHSSRNFKKLWSRKIENKEMYYLSILVSHCSLVCIQGSLFFSPSAPRCLLGPLSPQTRRAIWARENSWELSIWILEQT